MRLIVAGSLVAVLALPAASAQAQTPPASPRGALHAEGNAGRYSLRARDVPTETLLRDIRARTGLTIVAPGHARVSLEFDGLPAREAASRVGTALGGLVPLRASWEEPEAGAPSRRAEVYFLVRTGSRRQQLLDAYGLGQGGAAHQRLFELLSGEGAAAFRDTAAHARDASRSEGERVLTIKLLGALGAPEATAELLAILRAGPGSYARQAAALALGWAGRGETAPALRLALADDDTGVALSAAWALVRLGDRSGLPLALSHLTGPRALSALDVVAATGDPAHVPALEAALADARGLTRVRLRTTLVDLRLRPLDEAAKLAAAEQLLGDPDVEIRRHAAKTLAGIGTPAAEDTLKRLAANPARTGAGEAAQAVAQMQRARQLPPDMVFE